MQFGSKEIKVTIDAIGNPTVEAKGFAGAGCEAATKAIEDALKSDGVQVSRVLKPEFAAQGASNQQHVRGW